MNQSLKTILSILVVVFIALVSFSGGFVTGHLVPLNGQFPNLSFPNGYGLPVPSTPSADQQAVTPGDLQSIFKPFWEAWNIIHEQYVDQPVDDLKLMRGAINGMMQSLGDEHSTYMDPETFEEANADLAGSYEGIGAYVDTTNDYLTVISPIAGSPADQAGLQPGDRIIAIDGEDMTGVDPELARRKVLGPAGSVVKLTIAREGEASPLEFEIRRAQITVKSVTGEMLDGGIAYVQLTTFGDQTTSELKTTLKNLMAQNPKGLILDLRNNGGGYLQTAVEVTSEFQPAGVVLYEQYGDGKRTQYDVISGGLATHIPLVVLINGGSASASEIVAGALQDTGRAKLVGETSYGKGSVQNWVPLSDNQGAVRITIAKWLTPNGRTIHQKGLAPDVYVVETVEDMRAGRDPQLEAAVTTLNAILNGSPLPTSQPTTLPTVLPTATP